MRLVLATVLLASTSAIAADWRLDCPAQLATAQSVAGALPEGWSAVSRTASTVTNAVPGAAVTGTTPPVSISVFDGPPSEMADLVPDNPNARVVRWTFDKKRTRDIYIVCHYADTRFSLSRKAPAEVMACTLIDDTAAVVCK